MSYPLRDTDDAIDRQNHEFNALDVLVEAYRVHNTVSVVDDYYPEVRHRYEAALSMFLQACQRNGRFTTLK